MKKLGLLVLIILLSKIGFAQNNFEGEIDFKMFGLSDTKKDTTIGDPYKFFFGANIIKTQRLTKNGVVFEEQIIYLDSLKAVTIDYRFNAYWESWKGDKSRKLFAGLPWGMSKMEDIKMSKKIAGYDAYTKHLTNVDKNQDSGYIDLNVGKGLFFQLPPQIGRNMFLQGLLFLDDNIVLGIKMVAGAAPHTQMDFVATKVEAKEIDASVFYVPSGFIRTTAKQLNEDIKSGKIKMNSM